MTKLNCYFLMLFLIFQGCKSQQKTNPESIEETFYKEQKDFESSISNYLGNNFYNLHLLSEAEFTSKIDSLKSIFTNHLISYRGKLKKKTFNDEVIGIQYSFDKYLLEYPRLHHQFTGTKINSSKASRTRLAKNIENIDDAKANENEYFRKYVSSYLSIQSNKSLESNKYIGRDNQQLLADINTVDSIFSNQEVKCSWKGEYLYNHINNMGVKNIDSIYGTFKASCKTLGHTSKVTEIYNSHITNRASHDIEIYKEVDGFNLEMHIFHPDESVFKGKRPAIVYFHGGSWSQGKPDWFFETAKQYTKMGLVATAVEYRTKGRHGTYPFDAVKDAKTAIRWLRKNSERLNIDQNKIVATGNSAGGHLSIATVLVDNWNEATDNINTNATPNFVMVNAAVYDLTSNTNKWINEYDEDKNLVKEISPNELTKRTNTKFLLIHGENDRNCPYVTADTFYNKMKSLNNDIELHQIPNAAHFIWYGKHSEEVENITMEYINSQVLE